MENWVLCRIFLKKRNSRNDEEDVNATPMPPRNIRDGGGVVGVVGRGKVRAAALAEGPVRPAYYDFMTKAARVDCDVEGDDDNGRRVRRRCCLADLNLVPASCSSGSSGITEVSSGNDNDNNINSNDSNGKNEDEREESSSNNSLQLFGARP